LSGANTYSGNTTISGGTLALSGAGSISSSPNIIIGSSGTFDVSGLTTALSLASSQTLKCSATGNNTTAVVTVINGKNITLSSGGLVFTAYGGGSTSPLTVSGISAGALALNSAPITVTTTTPLNAGTYTLIAKSGSASGVTGTPGILTVNGSGTAGGTTASISVVSGQLILTVTSSGNTAPTLTTPTSTSVTTTGATLGATITANGGVSITDSGVVYGTSAAPTTNSTSTNPLVTSNSAFTVPVTSLSPQTLYYYRGFATNSQGTSYSSDGTFRTLSSPPSAQATSFTATTGINQLVVNWSGASFPGSGATQAGYIVIWAPTGTTPTLSSANGVAPAASAGTLINITPTVLPTTPAVTSTISGLTNGTLYNIIVIPYTWDGVNASTYNYLTSGALTTTGTPLGLPTLSTPTSTSVTTTGATLGATITANGGVSITDSGVVYGTSAAPTTNSTSTNPLVTSNSAFTVPVTSLSPQTLYYYRGFATNSQGTSYSSDGTFRTLSSPPSAQATSFTATTGINQLVVNWSGASFPGSGATQAGYIVIWAPTGTTPTLSSANGVAPAASAGTLINITPTVLPTTPAVTSTISGLTNGTLYNIIVIPYTWDGVNASTYNYLTSGALTTTGTPNYPIVSVPYNQNFESTTTEWNLGTIGTNKWAIGSATNNGGSKGLYISNDSGVSNQYTITATQTGTDAAIRVDLTGLTAATLRFDWKSNGEATFDYGEVYINNGSSDVLISSSQEFQATTTYSTKIINISAYVGSIITIKFRWVNDSSAGSQSPFAIDNISIVSGAYPSVSTSAISSITANTASTGGTITNAGGSTITVSGVCWNTSSSPTLSNNFSTDGATTVTNYTSSITGLLSNTTYYVRAYATNSTGTSYGNEVSFTTSLISPPVAVAATNLLSNSFIANWGTVANATSGYLLDVSTTSAFSGSIVSESFSGFTTNAGTTDRSSTLDTVMQTTGWTGAAIYEMVGYSKLGTGSVKGLITTPTLNLSINGGVSTLTFDLSKYGTDPTLVQVLHASDGINFVQVGSDITAPSSMTSQTISITGGTVNSKIRIQAKSASNNRFYLDNFIISYSNILSSYNNLSVNNTSQNVTGLSPNTTYYYRVRATDGSASTNSNVITVTTKKVPVVTPTISTYTYTGSPVGPSSATNTGTGTSYTFSYNGTGSTTYGPSSTLPTNAGTYTVTATVAADGDYIAASSSATAFTINKVTLTITAANQTICFGTSSSTVTASGSYTASGFVNSENSSVISGIATYTTTYTSSTTAGTTGVTITPIVSGLTASNYQFTPANGTITVSSLAQGSLTANGPFCATGAGKLTFTATAGTGPFTVVYNDGVADRTVTNVVSGTPFDVFTTPVTATTTYTLVSVTDALSCARTSGFTGGTATITINPLPTLTLGYIDDVLPTDTSFSIPFTATSGSPDKYSIITSTVGGGASTIVMPGFTAVTNATLDLSPIAVTIPASSAAEYGFVLTVTNSTTGCSKDYPFQFHVTSVNHGVIGANQTICSGATPAALTSITPGSASDGDTITYTWEKSTTAIDSGYTTIANETGDGYAPGALTQTTYFKRVTHYTDTNPDITSDSDPVTITVNASVGGTVGGSTSICSGATSGVLTLSGHSGSIVRWESAVSPFTSWTTISNTATTYTSGALTETTKFRAVVNNNSCGEATASPATITISTTTYDGTSWSNGVPDSSKAAIFTGNYTIAADFTACSLRVTNNAVVSVSSNYNVNLNGSISVDSGSSFTLNNNSNLFQSDATAVNTGNIIVKRNTSNIVRLDHTLWSSPVTGQNLFSFSPNTLVNRFYVYNTATNSYVTTGLSNTSLFTPAKGFAVRAPNNQSATTPAQWTGIFTGVPNNGTKTFTLATDAANGYHYNLVGNPYPSALSASDFYAANSSVIGGTLYFYAHTLTMNASGVFPTGTNYATWTLLGGAAATAGDGHTSAVAPNGIIQVGQGFIVKATAAGDVTFTNAMRVANQQNQFMKSATTTAETHRMWLNLKTDTGVDVNQILVGYRDGATQGVDADLDGLSFGNTGSYFYSKIDSNNYVIQARSLPFDTTDEVPLGFNCATAGSYSISLTNTDGLFAGSQDVLVRDNLTGTDTSIKTAPYTFTSEAGVFDSRFKLVYQQALGVPSTNFTENSVIVYKNTDWFHVTTKGIEMKDIMVYDISGRLIYSQKDINATTTVLNGLSTANQVLLLKITSQEGKIVTIKVIN
jgi:hypothetical protein